MCPPWADSYLSTLCGIKGFVKNKTFRISRPGFLKIWDRCLARRLLSAFFTYLQVQVVTNELIVYIYKYANMLWRHAWDRSIALVFAKLWSIKVLIVDLSLSPLETSSIKWTFVAIVWILTCSICEACQSRDVIFNRQQITTSRSVRLINQKHFYLLPPLSIFSLLNIISVGRCWHVNKGVRSSAIRSMRCAQRRKRRRIWQSEKGQLFDSKNVLVINFNLK